jgi:hypothetical protein
VPSSAAPGYGFRYRRWVLDSLRYADANDLATSGEHIPELADVYVDLALASPAPAVPPAEPGPPGNDPAARRSLGELLDQREQVVLALVGQPGSGKSTLLAQAARSTARPSVRWLVHGGPGRKRVPLLLALSGVAEAVAVDPEASLAAVARALAGGRTLAGDGAGRSPGREPAGWWERQLRRGRCLVLLDGLDEVPRTSDRLAVADWVEQQVARYPRNHFVVTARPYGLPDSLAAQARVRVVRPFTAQQMRLFLDRWYLAAEQHATGGSGPGGRGAVRLRAREAAARLDLLLREHPALQELAVNPLLLTMIATANRYRGALPASRGDLYAEICRVLLSRRAQTGDVAELMSWPAKQTLLAVLAYQMMRDQVTSVGAVRVSEVLGPLLDRYPRTVTSAAFLDDVTRSGLLSEAPAGRYSFAHLTFQEFLAARHVGATPGLVKSLADNVDDPWWRETILLYAASADASPIVRASLDSGTITALTLAFDCNEASTEIDPDLRRHLDRERARAYEPGCPPAHRRLIAGVLAARLVRRTLTAAAGTRVCAEPVPADLYWLFLADTSAPRPDRPCEPGTGLADTGQPATGIWGAEAQAFVAWLNSVTATAAGLEVRLPQDGELQDEDVAGALARQLPDTVTSAWIQPQQAQPRLQLWLRPGQSHPHELTGAAVREAVTADAGGTILLPQVLTAAVLDVLLRIVRDLDDARALGGALAGDLAARASSDGRLVELMHAHSRGTVLTYEHALKLTRSDAVTRVAAADPGLVSTLGLAPVRALADAIAGDLAAALQRAHDRAVELAAAIDLDLWVLSAFDFDVARAVELARAHTADLERAHVQARGLLHAPELGVAAVLGLPSLGGLEPALPLPAVLGLPLRWVADGPLAAVLLRVLAASPAAASDLYPAFAAALGSAAGVSDTAPQRAELGEPLAARLRELSVAAARESDRNPGWGTAAALGCLADACTPLSIDHEVPGPAEAGALRAVSLALASVSAADGADVLRSVAATVTVAERRSKDAATAGEAVILALV